MGAGLVDEIDHENRPDKSSSGANTLRMGGMVIAGVSGYSESSEFSEQLANAQLVRTVTNNRVTAALRDEMVEAVKLAIAHDSWAKTLKQNRWESSVLVGPGFNSFIETDLTTSRVMVHLLKMKT